MCRRWDSNPTGVLPLAPQVDRDRPGCWRLGALVRLDEDIAAADLKLTAGDLQTLVESAEGGGSLTCRVELAADLVVRESTAPPGV